MCSIYIRLRLGPTAPLIMRMLARLGGVAIVCDYPHPVIIRLHEEVVATWKVNVRNIIILKLIPTKTIIPDVKLDCSSLQKPFTVISIRKLLKCDRLYISWLKFKFSTLGLTVDINYKMDYFKLFHVV